jgi:hypothetical protein
VGQQFLYPRLPYLTTAVISANANGDNTIVGGIPVTRILVHRIWFVAAGAVSVIFKDGAGTNLSGAAPLAANEGFTLDLSGEPWFVTSLGNGFVINLSAGVLIAGTVYYTTTT